MTSKAVEEAIVIAERTADKRVIDMVDKVLKLPDSGLRLGLEAMKQVCDDDLVRLSEK